MKKSKGFTLIEMVVVLAILGIFLSGVGIVFTTGLKMWKVDTTQTSSQESLRTVELTIEKNLRKATSVAKDVNGCLVIYTSSTTSTYCYNSTNKLITLNGKVLADNISVFQTTLQNGNAQIVLHIVSTADAQNKTNTLDTTINIRKAGS